MNFCLIKGPILFALGLLLFGCVRHEIPESVGVKVNILAKKNKSGRLMIPSEFDCLGINVMGRGIPQSGTANVQFSMDAILSGSHCAYAGNASDSIAVSEIETRDHQISVRAVGGKDRVIQIYGVVKGAGSTTCPTLEEISAPNNESRVAGIYELGRVRTDLIHDTQEVSIELSYDPTEPKEMQCNSRTAVRSAYCAHSERQSTTGYANTTTPYKICTKEQLKYLASTPTDWGSAFLLKSNLVVAATDGLTAIGNGTTGFSGSFNGGGHFIRYERSSTVDNEGLFGVVTAGTISQLRVHATLSGGNSVGGIVGLLNSGTLSKCRAEGTIQSVGAVGGLIGKATGSVNISESWSRATVVASSTVGSVGIAGGLIGSGAFIGELKNSYAVSAVRGAIAGGIVGLLETTNTPTIEAVFSTSSDVVGSAGQGGFSGENLNSCNECFSNSAVIVVNSGSNAYGKSESELKQTATFTGYDSTLWNISEGSFPNLKNVQ